MSALRTLAAASVMAAVVAVSHPPLLQWLAAHSVPSKAAQVIAIAVVVSWGVLVYAVTAGLARSPELRDVWVAVSRRMHPRGGKP